ncbi:hypothetical protein AVU99_gp051 [Mycobacterium phage Lolly9]|uniref:Uncharacterized protein n=1 Tax=Mycobacterium phage Lolly9 TaxID=1698711 RepID=A0A0K2FN59_9CAUD|nr:hypothetical protein AVU99_gp051 [Mycobacterium phage Lolly9]ALA48546.1 hypothetical protein LOLLY9_139 [Mycobacterium phage Lolly9]
MCGVCSAALCGVYACCVCACSWAAVCGVCVCVVYVSLCGVCRSWAHIRRYVYAVSLCVCSWALGRCACAVSHGLGVLRQSRALCLCRATGPRCRSCLVVLLGAALNGA